MAGGRQTVERRQLGLILKRLRVGTKRSQTEAAEAIGRQQTRISRVEIGSGSLSEEQLIMLLDYYSASDEDRAAVLALGAQTRRRHRGRTYTDVLPGGFQRIADLEADATEIYSYEVGILPGLIQSPDYVRALIRACDGIWWSPSETDVDHRVGFRIDQQRRVLEAQEPKRLHFAFTEEALHHLLGGPAVMRGQILHLLNLIEHHPHLGVQVVPTDAADSPAPGGGFVVLEFDGSPRIGFASIVYGPSTYHDQEDDTTAMLRAFDRIRTLALSVDDSRDLLIARLKEL